MTPQPMCAMWRKRLALVILVSTFTLHHPAFAADAPGSASAAATPTPSLRTAAAAPSEGVAVVGLPEQSADAWPLARAVYAEKNLFPVGFGENEARALAGETPATDAPSSIRELYELAHGVRDDGAASRALLLEIAKRTHARAIAVVGHDGARIFAPDAGAFEAETYRAESGDRWQPFVRRLIQRFGTGSAMNAAVVEGHNSGAVNAKETKGSFLRSPWFWGALGLAAALGGAIYFAERDKSPDAIHLQMQVPK